MIFKKSRNDYMKGILLIFVLLFASSYLAGAQKSNLQQDFNRVAKTVKPCVVGITAFNNSNVPIDRQNATPIPSQRKIGSGIIFDNRGYILTNYHVIDQAKDIHVMLGASNSIKTKIHEATIVNTDVAGDMAILKIIPDEPLSAAKLGNSDNIKTGDWVMAIGNTFGFEQTITAGIVGAKNRSLNINGKSYQGLIQTDASTNQGNSGGPLVNMDGEVIGINTAIYSPDGAFSGMGFAIPINHAVSFINEKPANVQSFNQVPPSKAATPVAFIGNIANKIFPATPSPVKTTPVITKTEYLLCPNCQIKINQSPGIPWTNAKCPGCGTVMAHVIKETDTNNQNQQTNDTVGNQAGSPVGFTMGTPHHFSLGAPQCPTQAVAWAPGDICPYCGAILNSFLKCPWGDCPWNSLKDPSLAPKAPAQQVAWSPGDICPYCGKIIDEFLKCPRSICPWNYTPHPPKRTSQAPAKQVAFSPGDICPYCGIPLDKDLLCPWKECPWNSLPPQNKTSQAPAQQVAGCRFAVAFSPNVQNGLPANNMILVAGNQPESPYLGISLSPTMDGLQVVEVLKDSPAEKYGITIGDIIISINERKIKDITDFDTAMSKVKTGKRVRFVIIREGKNKIINLVT